MVARDDEDDDDGDDADDDDSDDGSNFRDIHMGAASGHIWELAACRPYTAHWILMVVPWGQRIRSLSLSQAWSWKVNNVVANKPAT